MFYTSLTTLLTIHTLSTHCKKKIRKIIKKVKIFINHYKSMAYNRQLGFEITKKQCIIQK